MKFVILESELRGRNTIVEADTMEAVWRGDYTIVATEEPFSIETVLQDVQPVEEQS